jgi:hypothetical protein
MNAKMNEWIKHGDIFTFYVFTVSQSLWTL